MSLKAKNIIDLRRRGMKCQRLWETNYARGSGAVRLQVYSGWVDGRVCFTVPDGASPTVARRQSPAGVIDCKGQRGGTISRVPLWKILCEFNASLIPLKIKRWLEIAGISRDCFSGGCPSGRLAELLPGSIFNIFFFFFFSLFCGED